jgi:hypothetical protein
MKNKKMPEWSLPALLSGLHQKIQTELDIARKTLAHPGMKGDASEGVWIDFFNTYLPKRYFAAKGVVVDHKGIFSHQIDVIIYDRQYTPLIFEHEGQKVVPAESVYAVFEAKQTINASLVDYAQKKAASVRKLSRTSIPIVHAGGTYAPVVPKHILGGILTFESNWNPPIGTYLEKALKKDLVEGIIDIGCVAAHGHFEWLKDDKYRFRLNGKPATEFLFKFIALLQKIGTVPQLDGLAYAKWLDK